MNKSTLLWLPLIALLLVNCTNRDREFDSYFGFAVPKDSLDGFLEAKMQTRPIPGLSIAIINDGEIVHRKHMGFANREKGIPVTDSTIFEGASMSKSVFGFFAMTFVESGQLDLDKPLYQYLPYADIAHDERYQKITARMVLSHRSGFPNWREDEPDQQLRLKFDPGTDYLYSGEGYQYLAMVLRHIEKTDWAGLEALFQERIARPLDMENSVFVSNAATAWYKAEPYDQNGHWIDWRNDYWEKKEKGVFGAAYSIHTETTDFARWMIGVMKEEILSPESYATLLMPHSQVPGEEVEIGYSLGFMKYPFPFSNTYGHGGNNEGFTCFYTLNTAKDWGFVIFTNSEYGQELGEELFFYLLFGPNLTLPVTLLILFLLITLVGIGFSIRLLIRKLKKN